MNSHPRMRQTAQGVCVYIYIYIYIYIFFFLAQESCTTCLYSVALFLNQRLSLRHTGGSAHGMYNDKKHAEIKDKLSRSINISTGIMLLA